MGMTLTWPEALSQQLNRYVAHLPDNSIGVLNEVKKLLNQSAENASSPLGGNRNMQRSAGFSSDATNVRDIALHANERVATGPWGNNQNDYEIALQVERDARQRHLEPLMQGPLGKLAKEDITTQRAIDALFPKNPLP